MFGNLERVREGSKGLLLELLIILSCLTKGVSCLQNYLDSCCEWSVSHTAAKKCTLQLLY